MSNSDASTIPCSCGRRVTFRASEFVGSSVAGANGYPTPLQCFVAFCVPASITLQHLLRCANTVRLSPPSRVRYGDPRASSQTAAMIMWVPPTPPPTVSLVWASERHGLPSQRQPRRTAKYSGAAHLRVLLMGTPLEPSHDRGVGIRPPNEVTGEAPNILVVPLVLSNVFVVCLGPLGCPSGTACTFSQARFLGGVLDAPPHLRNMRKLMASYPTTPSMQYWHIPKTTVVTCRLFCLPRFPFS